MINVKPGNPQLEDVLLVIMVMTFKLMVHVSFQQKIQCLLTQAVVLGTGKTKNVSNALTTGFSTLTESVFQFLTNAILLIDQATVSHAMQVITWLLENVLLLLFNIHLISVVVLGIGKIKNVSNALTIGSSTLTEPVFQFLTNAILSTNQETASHASSVIIWLLENVS